MIRKKKKSMQTESFLGEKDARREGTAVGVKGQKGLDLGPPGLREPASQCDYRQNHSGRNTVSKLKGKRCSKAGSWRGVAPGCTGRDEGIMQALCTEKEAEPAVAPGF